MAVTHFYDVASSYVWWRLAAATSDEGASHAAR